MTFANEYSEAMEWSFLTNHARVLIHVARNPDSRLRDIAEAVGITERATQGIVSELVETGYLRRHRVGRRNSYELRPDLPVPGALGREQEIGDVLAAVLPGRSGGSGKAD